MYICATSFCLFCVYYMSIINSMIVSHTNLAERGRGSEKEREGGREGELKHDSLHQIHNTVVSVCMYPFPSHTH